MSGLYSGLVFFILASQASSFIPHFLVRELGSSVNFTCPDVSNTNNTYKFSALKRIRPELIIPDKRFKIIGPILMIVNLDWSDNGQYFCSIFDSNGKQIGSQRSLGILTLKPVTVYLFTILPADRSSVVEEGTEFEFRCEYGKPSTEMKWLRIRTINGTKNEDYIPRNLITVLPDSSKSVEVYSIKKVTPQDTGTYRCEIEKSNYKRLETKTRVLKVKRAKAPAFGNMKPVFVVNNRDDLTIVLEVTGSPSPNISCYHKDRLRIFCSGKTLESIDISQNNPIRQPACTKDNYELTGYHELIIRSATFAGNDGMYNCEASNSFGSDSVHFRVNVTDFCSDGGKTYKPGERFISADCSSSCVCRAGGTVSCVSLCPPTYVQCDVDEKKIQSSRKIGNSDCTCPDWNCVKALKPAGSAVRSYRPMFSTAKLGSSYNFTCPAGLSKNYKYKFYTIRLIGPPKLITPDANTKQFGHVLMKSNLRYTDSGLYICSVYDQNDKVIKKRLVIGILSVFLRRLSLTE